MDIVHVVENLDDTYGGPARSIPNLAARTRSLGYGARLCSVAWSPDESNDVIEREGLAWQRYRLVGPRPIGFSPALFAALRDGRGGEDSILHLHNLWNGVAVAAYLAARRSDRPLVVSPRGSLYPWSLAQGRSRKRLAWRVFQKRALDSAAFVHVTEELELHRARELGITAPVAVVPNCVEQLPVDMLERWLDKRERRPAGRRVFLFLSRVHKKKGADLLLRAWARSAAASRGGVLKIVGPAEPGYRSTLDGLVAQLGIGKSVEFMGMLRHQLREAEFLAADVFVLPSHTENFGVAIVEALARGLPVLTTTGTPWPAIRVRGAGWWIELSVDNIVAALDDAATRSRAELRGMGENGAAIAREYGCDRQAERMAAAYEWVRGGDRPSFLHTSEHAQIQRCLSTRLY